MINNSNSDKRINVFFTESEPAYNLALNGQLYPNNEGSFCKIACAIYPRPAHEPPGEVIWQLI